MWLFTRRGFLSVVAHRDHPDALLVRSRFRGDLELLFPAYQDEVQETPVADYRYRVVVPRSTVAGVCAEEARGIDYWNFKSTIVDPARHRAYLQVWGVMARAQDAELQGDLFGISCADEGGQLSLDLAYDALLGDPIQVEVDALESYQDRVARAGAEALDDDLLDLAREDDARADFWEEPVGYYQSLGDRPSGAGPGSRCGIGGTDLSRDEEIADLVDLDLGPFAVPEGPED